MFLQSEVWLVRGADVTAIYEPIDYTMWDS
jgi:hypothetical protein